MADILVDIDIFIDHPRGTAAITVGKHRLDYSVVTRAELFAGTTATALERGLSVATRNRGDFDKIQGVRVRLLR